MPIRAASRKMCSTDCRSRQRRTAPSSIAISPQGPSTTSTVPVWEPTEGIIQNWWRQGMMGGAKAHYDGIVAFSQTDFTEDLKKISVPVLVMHGDDDQIVPYADSGPLSAKLVQNGTLKTYKGYPHGMPTTHADTINADLLAFIEK
jgi:non-heme chloroperoxidase